MRFASQSWMLKVDRRFSVMHVMKVGLAGSTCTQARHYESGQKKIRRLSKEKRKEMVESFIKKYQGLNNGNFPSLNLTHKEVGGSFYTIREIVRDIIQENRVLGPAAKSLEGDQDSDHSFKQFPLGTISTEPEEHSSPIGSYQHEESSEGLFFVSDKSYAQPDQSQINTGSHITNGIKAANDQVTEQLETSENMEEVPVSRTRVTEMAPITQTTLKSDGSSLELRNLKRSSVEKDVEIDTSSSAGPTSEEIFSFSDKIYAQPGQSHNTGSHIANDIEAANDLVTMKIMEEVPVSRSKVTDIADVTVETFPFPPITQATEKSDGSSIEVKDSKGLSRGSSLVDGLEVEFVESKQDELLYGKAVKATTDLPSGNSNSCITENDVLNPTGVEKDGYLMSSSSGKAVAETKVADVTEQVIVENSGTSEKKNKPTLDRVNLESWEVESKAPKTNPVVATLKSIIAAFTKFWS